MKETDPFKIKNKHHALVTFLVYITACSLNSLLNLRAICSIIVGGFRILIRKKTKKAKLTKRGYKYNPILDPVTEVNRIAINAAVIQYKFTAF